MPTPLDKSFYLNHAHKRSIFVLLYHIRHFMSTAVKIKFLSGIMLMYLAWNMDFLFIQTYKQLVLVKRKYVRSLFFVAEGCYRCNIYRISL